MLTFYHGTTSAALPGIKKEGLIPGKAPGGTVYAEKHRFGIARLDHANDHRMKSVYLTTNPWLAKDFTGYVKDVNPGEPVVLEVRIPKSAMDKLTLDENWSAVGTQRWGNGFRFEGRIPPKWIKVIEVEGELEEYY